MQLYLQFYMLTNRGLGLEGLNDLNLNVSLSFASQGIVNNKNLIIWLLSS